MLKAMRQNGSPPPVFETDEDRTFFLVRLPIHPHFIKEAEERKCGPPRLFVEGGCSRRRGVKWPRSRVLGSNLCLRRTG